MNKKKKKNSMPDPNKAIHYICFRFIRFYCLSKQPFFFEVTLIQATLRLRDTRCRNTPRIAKSKSKNQHTRKKLRGLNMCKSSRVPRSAFLFIHCLFSAFGSGDE